jgi:biofilm PGA synthesis N-glycosyltransferase PgaC
LILALFGIYWIAGPMTLLVLPLAMIVNYIMFSIQNKMFTEQGLKVRRNVLGFVFYALFYGIILQPACVLGYIHEVIKGSKKNWGTK